MKLNSRKHISLSVVLVSTIVDSKFSRKLFIRKHHSKFTTSTHTWMKTMHFLCDLYIWLLICSVQCGQLIDRMKDKKKNVNIDEDSEKNVEISKLGEFNWKSLLIESRTHTQWIVSINFVLKDFWHNRHQNRIRCMSYTVVVDAIVSNTIIIIINTIVIIVWSSQIDEPNRWYPLNMHMCAVLTHECVLHRIVFHPHCDDFIEKSRATFTFLLTMKSFNGEQCTIQKW